MQELHPFAHCVRDGPQPANVGGRRLADDAVEGAAGLCVGFNEGGGGGLRAGSGWLARADGLVVCEEKHGARHELRYDYWGLGAVPHEQEKVWVPAAGGSGGAERSSTMVGAFALSCSSALPALCAALRTGVAKARGPRP